MAALLKDAIKPNLVQTLEHTPVIIHGGPFANIAHGCNSVIATRTALKLGDYCITEAGFGADLGAEKFLDIKCRKSGLWPDAVVVVATIRALKYNAGVPLADLKKENTEALKTGSANLRKHVENLKQYGVNVAVTINRFAEDTDAEIAALNDICKELGVPFALSEVFAKGGDGGIELARIVKELCDKPSSKNFIYNDNDSLKDKIDAIAKKIYGAAGVEYSKAAEKELKLLSEQGFGSLPVCMAKTQYSLSDDPKALGAPSGFILHIREIYVSAGAGFVVAISGSIMSMPGLPKVPAAYSIDVSDENGRITGLF